MILVSHMNNNFNKSLGLCFECGKIIDYLDHAITIKEEIQREKQPSESRFNFNIMIDKAEGAYKIKRYHKKCFLENIAGEDFWD